MKLVNIHTSHTLMPLIQENQAFTFTTCILTFLFITTIIITRGFRIICGFARVTCSFLIFYSSMQTRELYKTLVYTISVMDAGTATMPILKLSWLQYLHLPYILMWQDSIRLLQTDTYLKIPSIIPNDLKSHIHKQANVTERSKQLYTRTVFTFIHSVCLLGCAAVSLRGQFAAFWNSTARCCQNIRNSLPCDTASHPRGHESCTHSTIWSKDQCSLLAWSLKMKRGFVNSPQHPWQQRLSRNMSYSPKKQKMQTNSVFMFWQPFGTHGVAVNTVYYTTLRCLLNIATSA